MPNALVIHAHPTPGMLGDRLAQAWTEGAVAGGLHVEHLVLRKLSFDPVLRTADQALEPDLLRARDAIERADHLVIAYPTWWAGPPALLKGFIDRVFLPGWAYRYSGAPIPEGLLRGRSARLMTTMDSPWWWYRLMHGRSGTRMLRDATLRFCGVRPVREVAFHRIRELDDRGREALVEKARRTGAADAASCLRRGGRRALSGPSESAAPSSAA